MIKAAIAMLVGAVLVYMACVGLMHAIEGMIR